MQVGEKKERIRREDEPADHGRLVHVTKKLERKQNLMQGHPLLPSNVQGGYLHGTKAELL